MSPYICICAYIREDMTDEYTLKILNATKPVVQFGIVEITHSSFVKNASACYVE